MITVGANKENKEDKLLKLTPQLVGYIAAALKAAGWKLEE